MKQICVAHLVWAPCGVEPFARFMNSYNRYTAGVVHRLLLVCKGFADSRLPEEWADILNQTSYQTLFIPDREADLHNYILAASMVSADYICFLNSYSEILGDGWLDLLLKYGSAPRVGMAGATGSWLSIRDNVMEKYPPSTAREMCKRILTGRRPVRATSAISGELARVKRLYPPLPNPHLRTNAFLLRRELWCRLGFRARIVDKRRYEHFRAEAIWLESSVYSLTRQVYQQGLEVAVVGIDGLAYSPRNWPESRTFWMAEQENLLIADNRTRDYQMADPSKRETMKRKAWGDVSKARGKIRL